MRPRGMTVRGARRWAALSSLLALTVASASAESACSSGDDAAAKVRPDGGRDVSTPEREAGTTPVTAVVVDEPDTDCTFSRVNARALYADAGAPEAGIDAAAEGGAEGVAAFDALHRAGSHRVAEGSSGEGFATFGLDGANATAPIGGLRRVAAMGSRIVAAGTSRRALYAAVYDERGTGLGESSLVALELPGEISLAASDAEAYAVWNIGTRLRGRAIGTDGTSNSPIVPLAALPTDDLSLSAAAGGGGHFAVAWSVSTGTNRHRTSFLRATATGLVGDITVVGESSSPRRVVQLVKMGSGYALLLQYGSGPTAPVLVLLDETGKPSLPAHRLSGGGLAWGLAVVWEEIGVLASHRRTKGDAGPGDPAVAFRPLGRDGRPIGGWVCFDAPLSDLDQSAAIDADGAGYAITYRSAAGSAALARVDRTGTGAP